jgi:CBS domain-containing protein
MTVMSDIQDATAADIMRRDVITVGERWDIRDALELFQENHISGAPVVDDGGDIVGVLSVSDIARAQVDRSRRGRDDTDFYRTALPDELDMAIRLDREDLILVSEVMTPLVIDAPEHTPVSRLSALMTDLHIHRVIITRGGKLAGIVSSLDLIRLLRR